MNALKEYRLKLGLSQKAFGERYGIPKGAMSGLERKNKSYTDIGIEPGDVFGRLTISGKSNTKNCKHAYWECRCVCGNTAIVTTAALINGSTKSCGCLRRESMSRLGKRCHNLGLESLDRVNGTILDTLNQKTSSNNTSGIKGVSFHRGRWRAFIKFQGKFRHLGLFDSKIAAADARRAAEKKYFEPILNEHGMILKPQEIDQDLLNDDTHRRRPFYDFGKGNDK